MRSLPLLSLLVLIGATAAFVFATVGSLPPHVATHFGGNGAPNGWMSRSAYTVFMLGFTVAFPLLVSAMAGRLPRLFPDLTNVPYRHYWMAPERRAATLDFLADHACWLGCLMAVMAGAVHWLIMHAHSHPPVRLATASFLTTIGLFLSALTVWIVLLLRRFRRPD